MHTASFLEIHTWERVAPEVVNLKHSLRIGKIEAGKVRLEGRSPDNWNECMKLDAHIDS